MILLMLVALPLWADDSGLDGSVPDGKELDGKELDGRELDEAAIRRLGDVKIASVRLEGLKKTRREIIEPVIGIKEGMRIGAVDFGALEQELRKTGLFGDISFRYRRQPGGDVELEIVLQERLSLVGIPVVATDGESWTLGATLFEANFLGLRRMLIGAGFYTFDKGPVITVGYIDPTFFGGDASLAIFTGGGNSDREDQLSDGEVFRSFTGDALHLTAALGLRTRKRLQPGLRFKYKGVFVDYGSTDSGGAGADGADVASAEMVGAGVSLGWEDLLYLRFFQKGLQARVGTLAGYDFRASGEPWFYELNGSASWAVSAFFDHLLLLEVKSGFSTAPVALQNSLPGGGGFRVIPASDSVGREFLAGAFTYELPLLRFSWGTGTVAAFFDGGLYDPDAGAVVGRQVFYGPGGGVRLYLDKVVFPALQLNFGWNVPTETYQFSFSLGMGMGM